MKRMTIDQNYELSRLLRGTQKTLAEAHGKFSPCVRKDVFSREMLKIQSVMERIRQNLGDKFDNEHASFHNPWHGPMADLGLLETGRSK